MKNKVLTWKDPETLSKLVKSLKDGNVSIVATDTILGLLSQANHESGQKLNIIKNRCNKPYILLIRSQESIFQFVAGLNEKIIQFLKLCWPGPVTIIFNLKKNDNFRLKSSNNTIGIRVPNHPKLLELLKEFNGLFSTSANLSGQRAPTNLNEIDSQILEKVDLIVLNDNDNNEILPSTILDCTGTKIKVIREGLYPVSELEKLYGEKFIK